MNVVVTDEAGARIHTEAFDANAPGAGERLLRLIQHYPPEFGWTITITGA